MPKVSLFNQDGKEIGEVSLNESIFGITPNKQVLFDAIILQRASLRQGTHKTKTRTEVRGGGRKPWRQKGTGRARQGSIRSPQWRGGGVVFGPTPRSYSMKMNKKVRVLALKSMYSQKVIDNEIIVLDSLVLAEAKTKNMVQVIKNLNAPKKTLFVVNTEDQVTMLAARNLTDITVVGTNNVSILDLSHHDRVVFTKEALETIEGVLA